MNRPSKVWFTAGLVALVAAACFDDPTSSLRNGPAALNLSRATVTVRAGDSVEVRGIVVDDAGNPLPVASVAWASLDASVAAVNEDVINPAPGGAFTRAFVRGVSNQAGVTTVTLTANGLSATLRATVLPATFPGALEIKGTAGPDTVLVNNPAPLPPTVVAFSAGDTLVVTATATVTFNAATSNVLFGATAGYLVSRTATELKVMPRSAFSGFPTITNVIYAGQVETGPIDIASLALHCAAGLPGCSATAGDDTVRVRKQRFPGTVAVAGDTVTIAANAGTTFAITGTDTTTVFLNGIAATQLRRTADSIRFIANNVPAALYVGGIVVRKFNVGAFRLDSVFSQANATVNRADFKGTAVVTGDSIILTAPAGLAFGGTGNTATNVLLGTNQGATFQRTAGTLKALSGAAYTGPVVLLNSLIGTTRVDTLKVTGTFTIAKASFGFSLAQTGVNALDTLTITATGAARFTTAGADTSTILIGGINALVVSRAATQMRVVPRLATGLPAPVTITGVASGTSTIPTLVSSTNVTFTNNSSNEANEPDNDTPGTVLVGSVDATTQAAPLIIFGAVDDVVDANDFFTITVGVQDTVRVQVTFLGVANTAGTAANADVDLLACRVVACTGPSTYGAPGSTAGGTSAAPENLTLTGGSTTGGIGLAPGNYTIQVNGYSTGNARIVYKLAIWRQ